MALNPLRLLLRHAQPGESALLTHLAFPAFPNSRPNAKANERSQECSTSQYVPGVYQPVRTAASAGAALGRAPAHFRICTRGFAAAAVPQPQDSPDEPQPSTSAAAKHAHASSPSAASGNPPAYVPLSQDLTYSGPLANTHKLLKRISIANTMIALVAAPCIVMYADVSYVSRMGLAASLVFFGMLTTGALHWISHPYVHELKYTAATGMIDARMSTLFGFSRQEQFHLSDVRPLPWDRPVATFMANGKFYYIDVYSFPEGDLLKRLTPDESTVPAGYKDDKDDD